MWFCRCPFLPVAGKRERKNNKTPLSKVFLPGTQVLLAWTEADSVECWTWKPNQGKSTGKYKCTNIFWQLHTTLAKSSVADIINVELETHPTHTSNAGNSNLLLRMGFSWREKFKWQVVKGFQGITASFPEAKFNLQLFPSSIFFLNSVFSLTDCDLSKWEKRGPCGMLGLKHSN